MEQKEYGTDVEYFYFDNEDKLNWNKVFMENHNFEHTKSESKSLDGICRTVCDYFLFDGDIFSKESYQRPIGVPIIDNYAAKLKNGNVLSFVFNAGTQSFESIKLKTESSAKFDKCREFSAEDILDMQRNVPEHELLQLMARILEVFAEKSASDLTRASDSEIKEKN